jgi:hypothetical protein
VRDIYMTVTAVLKISVNQTINKTTGEKAGKYLIIAPKILEVSMLKIFKDNEE